MVKGKFAPPRWAANRGSDLPLWAGAWRTPRLKLLYHWFSHTPKIRLCCGVVNGTSGSLGAPLGNALLVRAVTASGRDAIGARLTLTAGGRRQIDEVRGGGYHISQGDFRVQFGLAAATKADLTIRWPQGSIETIRDIAANQWITVQEGKGVVEHHQLLR